ncbi:nitric oxide synthase-interacting [Dipodascopsis tothii]|uniref:nitric oxide synthase-interacting n=1 Tax=Dipodascopsis tothii TaxID=44089 RepID=UPI0034CD377A
MARHSKRNTASSYFTAYERSLLKQYGRQRQRLTSDSFRELDMCCLCLMRARDPVACASEGHVYCRECIVQNLVAQHAEIKRMEVEMAEAERTAAAEAATKAAAETAKTVAAFEQQAGVGASRAPTAAAERRRQTAFWVPSQAPAGVAPPVRKRRLAAVCPMSETARPHALALRQLVSVKFAEETQDGGEPRRVCPACRKPFGNAMDGYLLKPCGHVVCRRCFDGVAAKADADGPAERRSCLECGADAGVAGDTGSPGAVLVRREGTGFAAAGRSEATKEGVAFQG